MKPNRGFTLLELLIAISIFGILAAMATPNVSDFIKNAQLQTSADNLYSLIKFGRAEAARQGINVQVGALDGIDWASGAIAWIEGDNVAGYDEDDDTLIRQVSINNTLDIVEATNKTIIVFNGQGYSVTASRFAICDDRTEERGRTINILVSGFASMVAKEDCL